MKLLELISKSLQVIEEDFYKRLLNGGIEKAKASSNFSSSFILDIQKELVKIIIITNDENVKEDLINTARELQQKFAEWKSLVDRELKGVSDKDFEKDSGTWRSLLEDMLKDPTNKLSITLNRLYKLIYDFKEREKDKEEIADRRYENKYKKTKFGKNVYLENLDKIEEVEDNVCRKIFLNDFSDRTIIGKIFSGPWKDHLHAYLPPPLGNHRIVYKIEEKKVIFCAVGTHNELGIN